VNPQRAPNIDPSEARLLIEALDALNRETSKDYGDLRAGLVRLAYGTVSSVSIANAGATSAEAKP
jgi:hypothetical protein